MHSTPTDTIKKIWEKGGIVKAQCDPYGKSEFNLAISADLAGLLSLTKILIYLANFPDGYQITLDAGGNIPIISNVPIRFHKGLMNCSGIASEVYWDETLFQSATNQFQIINQEVEEANKLPPSKYVQRNSVVFKYDEGFWIKAQKMAISNYKDIVIICGNAQGLRSLAGNFLCLAKYEGSPPLLLDRTNGLDQDSNVWLILRGGLI